MGKLELDQQPATPITVTGFGIGDAFDLTNVPLGNVTFSSSDNSLTIGESGSPALTLEGDYSESDFTLVTDAFGGTGCSSATTFGRILRVAIGRRPTVRIGATVFQIPQRTS